MQYDYFRNCRAGISAVMWRVGVSTWCHARLGCQAHPCLDLLDLHPTGLLSALVYAVAAERIFVVDFKSPTFTSLFQPLPIKVSDCMCNRPPLQHALIASSSSS